MTAAFDALPSVGFGCSPYRGGERVDLGDSIELALELGYQLLDTAEAYGNEAQIGQILRRRGRSAPSRPMVVSKLWRTNHAYRDVLSACKASLRRLGVEALDLYLIHAPEPWRHTRPLGDLSLLSAEVARSRTRPCLENGATATAPVPLGETWSAMVELVRRGLVRAIGVSNFDRAHLEQLLTEATFPPVLNQIERHPCRPRRELVAFCHERQIRVMAHSPLSFPALSGHAGLARIASRHGKSPAQVVLRWNLQLGVIPIPGSRNPQHIRENLAIDDFCLEPAEMAEIDVLSSSQRKG